MNSKTRISNEHLWNTAARNMTPNRSKGEVLGYGPASTAAHEVGHALGNREEYNRKQGEGVNQNGGVMNNPDNTAQSNNYDRIVHEARKDLRKEKNDCTTTAVGQNCPNK